METTSDSRLVTYARCRRGATASDQAPGATGTSARTAARSTVAFGVGSVATVGDGGAPGVAAGSTTWVAPGAHPSAATTSPAATRDGAKRYRAASGVWAGALARPATLVRRPHCSVRRS